MEWGGEGSVRAGKGEIVYLLERDHLAGIPLLVDGKGKREREATKGGDGDGQTCRFES